MQQLITIETIPISIKYVEKESSANIDGMSARLQLAKQDNNISIKSKPVRIKMDSFVQNNKAKTYNLTYTATAQYSDDGNLKLNVEMDNTEANNYVIRQFGRGFTDILGYLTHDSQYSSYEFNNMQINFDLSQLPNALPAVNNIDTSFMPPDFEIEVVERPKVIIKYVGGPIYIPKSADPDYEPAEKVDTKA